MRGFDDGSGNSVACSEATTAAIGVGFGVDKPSVAGQKRERTV